MTGLNTLYNKSLSQFVSTYKVIWNLPDWQQGPRDGMKLEIGDYVEIYVRPIETIGQDSLCDEYLI